jgi:hypothetical protein
MRRCRPIDVLLMPPARLVVLVGDRLWPGLQAALYAIERFGPLRPLRAYVARMPPRQAIPLFLVPELASRAGWMASVWLLVEGQAWVALFTYVATKLLAGAAALWIYHACAPTLMRLRWFAHWHHAVLGLRHAAWVWLAAATPRRFRAMLRWLRAGSSAAGRAPASPSPPDGPRRIE